METLFRAGFAVGIFLLMISWEFLGPRRELASSRKLRWPVNIGLALSNMLFVRFTVGGIAYLSAIHAQELGLGLLNLLEISGVLAVVITLLMLDFAIYCRHVISHKWPWLWRLHRVHHSDIAIDASTAVRFHPLEIMLSLLYKSVWIVLLGAEPFAVILFEVILNGAATFNHANVNIPERVDRVLRYVIITPDMHRIHHSVLREEADSNYGFSISLWDRLFKTYTKKPSQPQPVMDIGLEYLRTPRDLGFFKLLLLPFKSRK